MKKLFSIAGTAFVAAALLASVANAYALGERKLVINEATTAPVQDGVISLEEYAGNAPLVLDGDGSETEGPWASTSWQEGLKLEIYWTWDAEWLYMGLAVSGDQTGNQDLLPVVGSGDVCPFSKGDSIQIGFNPAGLIQGTHPLIYCVALNADGQPFVHGDAFRSNTDGTQSVEWSDHVPGYCTAYSATGEYNYVMEIKMRWDEIMVDGVGRSGEGAIPAEMSGELAKIGDGYELPFWFCYTDSDGAGSNGFLRTAAGFNGETEPWVAEEMCPHALVLKAAPEAEAPVEGSDVGTGEADVTGDVLPIALGALALSGAAAIVASKKRR